MRKSGLNLFKIPPLNCLSQKKKEIYFFLFKIQADRKSLLKVASEMLEELENPGENDIPGEFIREAYA